MLHIYPECKAFYCKKCALALVQLDNSCWAYNAPIDPLKPSIPYEKEKGDIDVEILKKLRKRIIIFPLKKKKVLT